MMMMMMVVVVVLVHDMVSDHLLRRTLHDDSVGFDGAGREDLQLLLLDRISSLSLRRLNCEL